MRGLRGICLGALAMAGSAEAGPWAQLQGDIYARANVSAERLDGEDGWRGDLYGEYGLGGGWRQKGKRGFDDHCKEQVFSKYSEIIFSSSFLAKK